MFSARIGKAEATSSVRFNERLTIASSRPPSYTSECRFQPTTNDGVERRQTGSDGIEPVQRAATSRSRNCLVAYLLWLFLGLFGGHHFYLRRKSVGVIYLCTLGLLGIGWLVDVVRLPFLVARSNRQKFAEETDDPKAFYLKYKKNLDDAYLFAFPLGFLGVHRFYLGQPFFGFVFAFTGGLLVIGWVLDLLRLPRMVGEYNLGLEQSLASRSQAAYRVLDEGERGGGLSDGVVARSQPLTIGDRNAALQGGSPASWDILNTPQNPPSYHISPFRGATAGGRLQDGGRHVLLLQTLST